MPDNTSEFFSEKTKQKWLDLVPRKFSLLLCPSSVSLGLTNW